MKRRLFNLFAIVSLVFCLAIVVTAVQSIWFHRGYIHSDWDAGMLRQNAIDVFGGCIQLTVLRAEVSEQDGVFLDFSQQRHGDSINTWRSWIWFDGTARRGPLWLFGADTLRIPLALLAVLTAIPPWLWCRRTRRVRLAALHNSCLACGYNLTGNVSGVCPECGTAVGACTSTKAFAV
jgi:hypothetical protein